MDEKWKNFRECFDCLNDNYQKSRTRPDFEGLLEAIFLFAIEKHSHVDAMIWNSQKW